MEDFSPIARLERIVKAAKSQSNDLSAKKVWSQVFKYSTNDNASVVDFGIEYLRLVEHVDVYFHVVVHNYEGSETNSSSMIALKELGFSFASGATWNNFSSKIDASVLVLLEMGKALYNSYYPQPEIKLSDDQVDELKASLEDLFDTVFNSSLSRELRLKLCADIVQMKNAISFYEMRGADGLQEGVATMTGRYAFNANELNREEATDVREKFGDFFQKLFSAMSHANTLHQFIGNAPEVVRQLVERT